MALHSWLIYLVAVIGLSVTPPHLVGFVSGNYLFTSNLAAALCPFISGYLIQWTGGYEASFYVSAALPFTAAIIAIFAVRRRA